MVDHALLIEITQQLVSVTKVTAQKSGLIGKHEPVPDIILRSLRLELR